MMIIPLPNLGIPVNPIHEDIESVLPNLDDDVTLKLQSGILPLEVQLMLEPMWIVRSKYHECMRPLDKAMEQYMQFRCKLKEIDLQIELGSATTLDVVTAFDQVFRLLNIYEKNQKDLQCITREVNHQLSAYAHVSKNDLMWNEMLQLKQIDYISFTRRTCTFEHVVTCLFKLDENLKESIRSSLEIAKCCANYLLRIVQSYNNSIKNMGKSQGSNDTDNSTLIASSSSSFRERTRRCSTCSSSTPLQFSLEDESQKGTSNKDIKLGQ